MSLTTKGKHPYCGLHSKNRVGVSSNPLMQFDLQSLINLDVDLSSLVVPFTSEEIDRIIKIMPPD